MSTVDRQAALDYHEHPVRGKISVNATKPLVTQRDLALAYTPGVAAACEEIVSDSMNSFRYTSRGNLVGVITNGSAVLGLGNIGAEASKPVMEGKAVLFKKFAGIDVFDIEINESDPDKLIETIASLEPTFGGINLEDIKAPECFKIERALRERMKIPVFHDDQHGTAVITAAGLLNALELQGKTLADARIVCVGAGAAGIASMRLLVTLGARLENIRLLDRAGVIHDERTDLNEYKREFAVHTSDRTLDGVITGADVFIGLSGPNILSAEQVKRMAARPIVFALSNPDPEIEPAAALAARDDLIMATGRSDYPNQVNNVLGFPFIFRGALDVRASTINDQMLVAAVHALAALAREPVPQEVLSAYRLDALEFGPGYIIPKPLDPRLIDRVPPAVAAAAVESGIARLPYPASYPRFGAGAAGGAERATAQEG